MIDIDTMEAGPKLDSLVAEKVMGLRKSMSGGFDGNDHEAWFRENGGKVSDFAPPPYSSEIAAAWLVVGKLRPGKFVWIKDCGGFGWRVEILSSSPTDVQIDFAVVANTAPLAICRAALKVVGR